MPVEKRCPGRYRDAPMGLSTKVVVTRPEHDRPLRAWWRLNLSQLWVFVVVAFTAMFLEGRLLSVDLAYHIRAGEIMVRTHSLIRSDTLSFTAAGRPWLDQQWGAQLLFASLYRAGGWAALGLFKAALVAVIFSFVYLACRGAGASVRLACGLTLASFIVTGFGLPLRPQLLALALFAATLWIVFGRRQHPGRMLAVPVMVAVWANIHGSFFLAPLVLGLAWLEDRRDRSPVARTTMTAALASVAAATLNPFGLRVWTYAFGISTNPLIARIISEWQAPTIRQKVGATFFLSGVAAMVVLARRSRPAPWLSLLWLGVFFLGGLLAVRNILWWALVAPPVLAGVLRGPGDPPRRIEPSSALHTVIAGSLVAVFFVTFPWWGKSAARPPQDLLWPAPPGITAAVSHLLPQQGRLFNAQLWGSWFELSLPTHRVFVDSRIEVYPASVWSDYENVSRGHEGWQRILDRWGVSVVAADRKEQKDLIPLIAHDPNWRLAFSDRDGFVFVRRAG
jgi:hypothetical protein